MKCRACGAESPVGVFFCSCCGRPLAEGEPIECENHVGVRAAGVCVLCGKPVCGDCASSEGGRTFCEDVSHRRLTKTHSLLGRASSEGEAELIAKNLQAAGISVAVFPGRSFFYLSRLTGEERTAIYTAKEEIPDAVRIIGNDDLTEFITFEHPAP